MLLELKKVSKFYGPKLIFKNVSLGLDAGQVMLVAGPNGAGKSTLLRVMSGLEQASAGKFNCDVGPEKIGYLGHNTFIYPELSGLENLAFWTKLYGLKRSKDELLVALERMELKHAAQELAGRYSRGMAQRLSLARVFLLEPSLIFLDEPGTGLDIRSSAILAREIDDARARGAGLVWVSHHLEKDLLQADLILELRPGKACFFGNTEQYEREVTA